MEQWPSAPLASWLGGGGGTSAGVRGTPNPFASSLPHRSLYPSRHTMRRAAAALLRQQLASSSETAWAATSPACSGAGPAWRHLHSSSSAPAAAVRMAGERRRRRTPPPLQTAAAAPPCSVLTIPLAAPFAPNRRTNPADHRTVSWAAHSATAACISRPCRLPDTAAPATTSPRLLRPPAPPSHAAPAGSGWWCWARVGAARG